MYSTAHADHRRQGTLEKQLQDGCRSISLLVHGLVCGIDFCSFSDKPRALGDDDLTGFQPINHNV